MQGLVLKSAAVAVMSWLGLSAPTYAAVTNIGFWRGGEDDSPAPAFNVVPGVLGLANSTTVDSTSNGNTLNGVNNGGGVGPYYVNPGSLPESTVSYSFDPGAGNTFSGTAITTGNTNWGIQCYTTSTQDGTILISNGDATGGGYALFLYNSGSGVHYSGLLNGIAVLEGTKTPTGGGQWQNVALVSDNGMVKLFVDGVLDVSAPIGGSSAATGHLTIGSSFNANSSTYTGYANGNIDEARLFTFNTGEFQVSDLNNYVPIPEPTTGALVGLAGLFGLSRRRTREV